MPKPVRKKKKRTFGDVLNKKPKDYTNAKPLECCEFKSLNRCLGLHFSEPFMHQGLGVEMVDCSYETVTVNTKTFGGPKLIEELEDQREEMTLKIILDIDTIVGELLLHKGRLLKDMGK